MEFLTLTSVAEVYRYIKQFHFESGYGIDPFTSLTFSDSTKIRLDPTESAIRLRGDSDGYFSTDTDIWARTWTTNPLAVRKLLMVQIFPNLQPEDTSVLLRIYDGTEDLYWDGAAWSTAGAGDWNTEAEINANIESFPILPDREFAITVNLQTTDQEVTSSVSEIRVLTEMHIDFIEDVVLRSVLPTFESEIRPVANMANIQPYTSDVTTIDLSEYRINTPYNIVDVTGVYDFTDDAELLYNLLDSYNPSTQVITLLSALPSGHRPFITFRYVPEIADITHQDWIEVSKVPSLFIQRLEIPVENYYNINAREGIVDKGTGNAVRVYEPFRATFEFRIHGITANLVDSLRMQSKIMEFFETNQFLRSVGLDEYYRMKLDRQFREISTPNNSDLRVFWTRFSVFDVKMPLISEDATAVTSLNITYVEPKPPHEDPVKGGSKIIPVYHRDDGPVLFTETKNIT